MEKKREDLLITFERASLLHRRLSGCNMGLNTTDILLLSQLIKSKEPLNMTAAAKVLGVSKPAVSQMVGKLEGKGLIKREKMGGDKKAVFIKLTESSDVLYSKARESYEERMRIMESEFGDEFDEFIRLVNKFCDIVERLTSKTDKSDNQPCD